jgi:hypothetical protein
VAGGDPGVSGGKSSAGRIEVAGATESGDEAPRGIPPATIPAPSAGSTDADGAPGLLIAGLAAITVLLAATAAAAGRRPAEATEGPAATAEPDRAAAREVAPSGEPGGRDGWSADEETVRPPPWAMPAEASDEQPSTRREGRAQKPFGSSLPRSRHPQEPGSSPPSKRD